MDELESKVRELVKAEVADLAEGLAAIAREEIEQFAGDVIERLNALEAVEVTVADGTTQIVVTVPSLVKALDEAAKEIGT